MIFMIVNMIMMKSFDLFHTASWSLKPASHRHSPAAVQLHVNQFLDDASFGVGERERVRRCVQTTLCRLHPLLFQPWYKILCAAKEDEQLGPVHRAACQQVKDKEEVAPVVRNLGTNSQLSLFNNCRRSIGSIVRGWLFCRHHLVF